MGVSSALDIGANVGWFTINLSLMGVSTVAVESFPKYSRVLAYAIAKLKLKNTGVLMLRVAPETVSLLPNADCVLFMSVWHHMVRDNGFDRATALLREIWQRSNKLLIFETGQREMPPSFNLPAMEPTAKEWILAYLSSQCAHSQF